MTYYIQIVRKDGMNDIRFPQRSLKPSMLLAHEISRILDPKKVEGVVVMKEKGSERELMVKYP